MDRRAELTAEGRALRATVPRSSHGEWTPSATRRDPVEILEDQAKTRIPELIPYRYGRMSESPFAFYRGCAAVMAMDLSTSESTGLFVQTCGDAHVNNFGEFATPEGNIIFDINDFDETLPGPWEWDVKRLCASLAVVARQVSLSKSDARMIVRTAAREYRERIAGYASMRTLDMWHERIAVDDVIAHFPKKYRPFVKRDVAKARRKDHVRAVAKLTEDVDGSLQFIEDPPLIVRFDHTEFDVGEAVSTMDNYRLTLTDDKRDLLDRYHVVDTARKAVGVGSVGTHCWVALFEGPRHTSENWIVLQIKEAQHSVLEPYVGESALEHQGLRVVAGQRLIQAASDSFLGWTQGPLSGRNYYVRQLWNVKGQGDPLAMDVSNLAHYGALCAWSLARAHAKTGDPLKIAGYLGTSSTFELALVSFSERYATVNEDDYTAFIAAIKDGRIEAASET